LNELTLRALDAAYLDAERRYVEGKAADNSDECWEALADQRDISIEKRRRADVERDAAAAAGVGVHIVRQKGN
jgi:hypothetical protein